MLADLLCDEPRFVLVVDSKTRIHVDLIDECCEEIRKDACQLGVHKKPWGEDMHTERERERERQRDCHISCGVVKTINLFARTMLHSCMVACQQRRMITCYFQGARRD